MTRPMHIYHSGNDIDRRGKIASEKNPFLQMHKTPTETNVDQNSDDGERTKKKKNCHKHRVGGLLKRIAFLIVTTKQIMHTISICIINTHEAHDR